MTLTVPCLFGLESLVADEMRRLDLKNVQAENGRVHCEGTLADIARLNINLRCGARVLMELGSFPARDFEALFQGVYALPWENYIPRDGEFPVKGYSLNSQLHSVPACQSIVKKASAKRLGEKYGVETLPESGSRYQIQFSIIKDGFVYGFAVPKLRNFFGIRSGSEVNFAGEQAEDPKKIDYIRTIKTARLIGKRDSCTVGDPAPSSERRSRGRRFSTAGT